MTEYAVVLHPDVYAGIVEQAKVIVHRWEHDRLWRWCMRLFYGVRESDIDFYRYVIEADE